MTSPSHGESRNTCFSAQNVHLSNGKAHAMFCLSVPTLTWLGQADKLLYQTLKCDASSDYAALILSSPQFTTDHCCPSNPCSPLSVQTGLTPLMEAASGGYVEVGRVLLDKGADVNAPPVPSSRDTALTIAADKGHYRFVELLLSRSVARQLVCCYHLHRCIVASFSICTQ